MSNRFKLYGTNFSPFSCKIRSVLRYKRLGFDWHRLSIADDWNAKGLGMLKQKLVPVLAWPRNAKVINDSTFIIQELDETDPERPVLPKDPFRRFVSNLLEDYSDEWLARTMFGMRWDLPSDQKWGAYQIALDFQFGRTAPPQDVAAVADAIARRQQGRMGLVGCEDPAVVMRVMQDTLGPLERHFATGGAFLLGRAPSAPDFALYGQIKQLTLDGTPAALLRSHYPSVMAWVGFMEDLSGLDDEHDDRDAGFTPAAAQLLKVASRAYLPFMRANAASAAADDATLATPLWGGEVMLRQPTMRYQAKCFDALRFEFGSLDGEARHRAVQLLEETGCLEFFTAPSDR